MTEDERNLLLLLAGFADRAALCLGDEMLLGEARSISRRAFAVERAAQTSDRQTPLNPFACADPVGPCLDPPFCRRAGACIVGRVTANGRLVLPREPR